MTDPFEEDPGLVKFNLEASKGIAEIPALDEATIDVALGHLFKTFDEVTMPYHLTIFELKQRLLVEDLTPTERIDIREKIAEQTLRLEAIIGAFSTVADRINS